MDKDKEFHSSFEAAPASFFEAPEPAKKAPVKAKVTHTVAAPAKEKEAKVSDANPAVTLADDADATVEAFAASLEWEARRIYGGEAGGKAAKWSVKGSTICIEFK